MKRLIFNKDSGSHVWIPYYRGGEIDEHILGYLVARYLYPSQIKDGLNEVTKTTIDLHAGRIAFLVNIFEENGFTYLEAQWEHVSKIICALYEEYDWKGASLKLYVSTWRLFYEYLSRNNVPHNMIFPERKSGIRMLRADDDFLSHTRLGHQGYEEFESETAVPSRYCVYHDDYRERVISMEQWFDLYACLYADDPVYAVMAATMMQTFLRIGGIFQFPLGPNKINPRWKRFAQLKRAKNSQWQDLHYIKKGQRPAKCTVHLQTMKMVEEEYLTPFYDQRRLLYEGKYLKSKHAKNLGRNHQDIFIWLNKNGTPVSRRELQSAFERASKTLGFAVTPHYMRHTGASQILWYYSKSNNITLDVNQSSSIHVWLKLQLGHVRIETTEHYIRTVLRLEAEDILAEILPTALPVSMDGMELSDDCLAAMKRAIEQNNEFFKGC